MKQIIKLFLPLFVLISFKTFAATSQMSEMDINEHPNLAYVSVEARRCIMQLKNLLPDYDWSNCFQNLCRNIEESGTSADYDHVSKVVDECLRVIKCSDQSPWNYIKDRLEQYKNELENGDALITYVEDEATKGKKCKKFCRLFVKECLKVCGNLIIGGNLTVGGTLTVGSTTISAAVFGSSLIPFASGILGTTQITALTGSGLVMGFGANAPLLALTGGPLIVTETQFAFTVPAAGTIHTLNVRADANFVGLTAPAGFDLTFEILRSTCTAGTAAAYTVTPISTTVTITPPGAVPGAVSACGSSAASIAVAAGDQIVLHVIPSSVVTLGANVSLLGLSAGILYTPA
ncbi:hypothetical protein M1446_00015 [Candidatus Dependentiae bacterium]|nr:hypothetical protein [Candidatus Dependentiae bacterium]